MSNRDVGIWILMALILLGSGSGLISLWNLTTLSNRTALTTPIVVLDRAAELRSLPEGSPPEARQLRLLQMKELADHYAAAGYLVIDSGWVIAAPEELYVR